MAGVRWVASACPFHKHPDQQSVASSMNAGKRSNCVGLTHRANLGVALALFAVIGAGNAAW